MVTSTDTIKYKICFSELYSIYCNRAMRGKITFNPVAQTIATVTALVRI